MIAETAYNELKKYLNMQEENKFKSEYLRMYGTVTPSEQVMNKFGSDFRMTVARPPKNWKPPKIKEEDETGYYMVDEWGSLYRKPKVSGSYYDLIESPLKDANVEDLDDYDWPDPRDPGRTEGLYKEVKDLYENTEYAITFKAELVHSIFEQSYSVRGMENLFKDLVINQKFAEALMDKILEIGIGLYDECLSIIGDYIHVVQLADDLGMQDRLWMSPATFRKFLKPREKKLIEFIKKKTKAKVFFHSDGAIRPLITDLIDVGVDILNPIQVSAVGMGDTRKLKEEFGDKLTFWGGFDTQKVLPFGTPEEVKEEAKKRIRDLAPGGGYVFNTVMSIQPKVPPENICTMFETATKFGRYPIAS